MIFIKRGNEVKSGTEIMYVDRKAHLYNSHWDNEQNKEIEEITELTPDWEVYTI